LLLATALLSGCASLGNGRALEAQGALPEDIVIGRSTRNEVRAALGEASIYRYADGKEAWIYRRRHGLPRFVQFVPYLSLVALAMPPTVTELALLFDEQGVLRRTDWRE
jgi:hypothetical protein